MANVICCNNTNFWDWRPCVSHSLLTVFEVFKYHAQYLKVFKYLVQYLVFKYYLNTPKCEVFHKVFKYSVFVTTLVTQRFSTGVPRNLRVPRAQPEFPLAASRRYESTRPKSLKNSVLTGKVTTHRPIVSYGHTSVFLISATITVLHTPVCIVVLCMHNEVVEKDVSVLSE